jgi:hypothetical protein
MNSLPPHDPLVGLWQTTSPPDTRNLLHDLQRLNWLHQKMKRSLLAILCGISILLVFEEATGRLVTHGALSAIWIFGIAIGVLWRRRARCHRSDALASDTVSLLRFPIARAKSEMFVAGCLWAGVPCGALVGLVVAKLAGIGAVLARSRRLQVRELTEKLKFIESEL